MLLEESIRQKYRVVLIRSPHEIIQDQKTSLIFPRLVELKTLGYRKEYGDFVLPFDSSDFIASHLLLCEILPDGDLKPVLGFKSVTLKKCDDYKIPFPMIGMLVGSPSSESHRDTITKILNQYREKCHADKIAYNGSFTILPQLRENKLLMKHLWEITFSLLTNYYIEYEIDHVLAVCATKFNVHKKKEELGWNFIKSECGQLPAYECFSLFGASLIPMELVDVKTKSAEASARFKDLWLNRLTLDKESIFDHKKAA